MNIIKIITGKAKTGKTYFAYNSLSDDIRRNNKVLTLDFYGDSCLNGFVYAPNRTFMISDVDCIVRNLTSQLKKYNVIIFDGFEQLISRLHNEINYVNSNSYFFDNTIVKIIYIRTKMYEWITSLLTSNYDIILVYNPDAFEDGDCKYLCECLIRTFDRSYYKQDVKVINYEAYFNADNEQFIKKIDGLDKVDLKMDEMIEIDRK